jgi:hypothetical protein
MIIFLHIQYVRVPFIDRNKRLVIKLYGGIYHISATFGYAETEKKSVYSDILLLAKELYELPIPSIETKITFFYSKYDYASRTLESSKISKWYLLIFVK